MSCLFRSLSYFITNVETDELRQIITDYISKDPIPQETLAMEWVTMPFTKQEKKEP